MTDPTNPGDLPEPGATPPPPPSSMPPPPPPTTPPGGSFPPPAPTGGFPPPTGGSAFPPPTEAMPVTGVPLGPPDAPAKKGKGPIIAAVAAVVLLLGGLFVAFGGDDDDKQGVSADTTTTQEDGSTTTEEADGPGGKEGATDEGDKGGDPTDTTASGGPQGYGDDPALDALYDQCEAGDFQACDDLYMDSPFGSAYEEFGDTCGDRNEPSGYCVDLYSDGGDDGGGTDSIDGSGAMSYGDNAQLDALYDQCEAGDFQACDTLYMESDFGSEYEEFGDTCGDRNEPQGYCVDVYAEDGGD